MEVTWINWTHLGCSSISLLAASRAIPGCGWSGNQHFTLAWRIASIQQQGGICGGVKESQQAPATLQLLPPALPLPPQPHHTLHTGHRYFHTSDSPRSHVVWSSHFVLFHRIVALVLQGLNICFSSHLVLCAFPRTSMSSNWNLHAPESFVLIWNFLAHLSGRRLRHAQLVSLSSIFFYTFCR